MPPTDLASVCGGGFFVGGTSTIILVAQTFGLWMNKLKTPGTGSLC